MIPFVTVLPVTAAFFVCGYLLQATVIQQFVTRPEHAQFLLLLAIATILTNALLIVFGPDARSVQLDYLLESIEVGPLLVDRGKFYAALVACAAAAALFAFFRFIRTGMAIRASADSGLGAKMRASRDARRGNVVMGKDVAAPDTRNSPIAPAYVARQSTHTVFRTTNDA